METIEFLFRSNEMLSMRPNVLENVAQWNFDECSLKTESARRFCSSPLVWSRIDFFLIYMSRSNHIPLPLLVLHYLLHWIYCYRGVVLGCVALPVLGQNPLCCKPGWGNILGCTPRLDPIFFCFGGHKSFLWGYWHDGQPYSHLVEAYMLHVCCNSPLVWYLLTSWQLAHQLSCSLPCTCKQELVRLETRICHAADECFTNLAMAARLNWPNLVSLRNHQWGGYFIKINSYLLIIILQIYTANCMLYRSTHLENIGSFQIEEGNYAHQDCPVFVSTHQNWPVFVRPSFQY